MANATEPEKYEVLEKIGHGSFGIIRKVRRHSDGLILCRKEISYIKMSAKEREQLHAEFSILNSLKHPNIVGYYHREHLKSSQDLHLYMEYCGGGDLSKVIEKLRHNNQFAEEDYVWSIFAQIVTALYRCHYGVDPPEVGKNCVGGGNVVKTVGLRGKYQVMILHRDLKPENIFLGADNSVKLGDFGLSKLMQSHDFASTYVGTPFYMSPEICAAERYTLHSDIWSLGCIMYELCAKTPPFNAKTHFHLVQKIKTGRVDPLPSIYSPELQKVIASCLKTNPLDRPDTAQLLNLPVVRLMRKEREAVEVGRLLRTQEEQVRRKAQEVDVKLANLTTEQEKIKASLESTVRREWELKARLEIDRLVQLETANLRKKFNSEVRIRVDAEVQRHLGTLKARKDEQTLPSPPPESQSQASSAVTDTSTSFLSSMDLSSLSLDSPTSSASRLASQPKAQPKKTTRTPFSRARTTYDSPMDVQMSEPSPMSIASLSLSPRRTGAAPAIPNSKNIFAAAAAQNSSKLTTSPSNSSQLDPTILEDDDEEGEDALPDLPSPTRLPSSSSQDPFKLPNSRPGLTRQNTAPTKRLTSHPTLFPTKNVNHRPQRIPSPPNATSSGSPVRKAAPKPLPAGSGENEMFKAVMQKNLLGNTGAGGRTLVELAQARAGGRVTGGSGDGKVGVDGRMVEGGGAREVVVWDPEKDEMPSPFLVRGGRGMRRL